MRPNVRISSAQSEVKKEFAIKYFMYVSLERSELRRQKKTRTQYNII